MQHHLSRLILVDGSGFIFRAFHALPPLSRSDGTPVGAVLGFTRMLMKLRQDYPHDAIIVVFDAARKTFRQDIYPDYKAHRPDPPPDLIPQFSLVRLATQAFSLPAIDLDQYEADDIIATYARLAKNQGWNIIIVSSDKDLMQLVDDRVTMFDPLKNKSIGRSEVIEKFQVPPEQVCDVQALMGDSSDNIPGARGIGPKTAAELIQQFGNVETLLTCLDQVRQPKRRQALEESRDLILISRRLVELKTDVPIPLPLEKLQNDPLDPQKIQTFLMEQGFKSVLGQLNVFLQKMGINTTSEASHNTQVSTSFGNYTLVQDLDTLKRWVDDITHRGCVAVDTETTALNEMRAKLVGISLALDEGKACYIPIHHQSNDPQIPIRDVVSVLKPVLEDPAIIKIGHNIKYDAKILLGHDINVQPCHDTMIMSYVLHAGLHGHGMDDLAMRYLHHTTISFSDVVGTGQKQVTFDHVDLQRACQYAAEDADVTWRLYQIFKQKLIDQHLINVYERIDRPMIHVLTSMERRGVLVDKRALETLQSDFQKAIDHLEKTIHDMAGHPFNIGSPKQLGDVLFEEMGYTGGKKGKSGAYGTDVDVLEQLAVQGCDMADKVLQWRQYSKLKSTYCDGLIKEIHPETNKIYTSYALTIAQTGRLSSSDPNLQNIPIRTAEGRKIRSCFVASPGHVWVSFDYSQIELRLLAHFADIKSLKIAFKNGLDIHAVTASEIWQIPVDQITPELRRQAKTVNFGIIYGISAYGLSQQLRIPQADAQSYIQRYMAHYPGIIEYMEKTKTVARQKGFVETLLGRRIHLPNINSKNFVQRQFAERQAINAPLQGSAADLIKRAMIRIDRMLQKQHTGSHMILQVHDELVFETPEFENSEHEVEALRNIVTPLMVDACLPDVTLSVPLEVHVGHGKNWEQTDG